MMYDPQQPLVSIHIPKTGGTSLKDILGQWFDNGRLLFHYVDEVNTEAPPHHELISGVCIHGHFNKFRNFGVWDYYPECRQFITFIRDPFEQHVSLFFYLRKHPDIRFAGRPITTSAWRGVDEFLGFLGDNLDVVQKSFANTMLAHIPMELDTSNCRHVLKEDFIHVGTTDRLGESITLLARKLGHSTPAVPVLNRAERDLPVSTALRAKHETMFPVEHQIYAVARDLQNTELRSMPDLNL